MDNVSGVVFNSAINNSCCRIRNNFRRRFLFLIRFGEIDIELGTVVDTVFTGIWVVVVPREVQIAVELAAGSDSVPDPSGDTSDFSDFVKVIGVSNDSYKSGARWNGTRIWD